jgi:apolipoprotein N-acyltransferase
MKAWKLWAAAAVSAALLELPFPLAGPMPAWRAGFAWIGLAPLLWAVLSGGEGPRPLRRAFLLGYLSGVLWYMGNCYWIYATMHIYGGLPPVVSVLLLVAYSLVLGLYFGLFAAGLALVRQKTGSTRLALGFAPFLWTALELAAARITSVPWDQLGYSQIENQAITALAPWTGVYGITFLIVAVNALIVEEILSGRQPSRIATNRLVALVAVLTATAYVPPVNPAPTDTAVLVQPNLNVGGEGFWSGQEWDRNMAQFAALATEPASKSTAYIAGIPETGASLAQVAPAAHSANPDLVAWPESPAPFIQGDPRLEPWLRTIALEAHAPLVVGGIGLDAMAGEPDLRYYNSAMVIGADGRHLGRYDKIHLVPFGEYIPFQELLTFAHKLTGRVGAFSRGTQRKTFLLNAADGSQHRYGVFICYEAVFADEVRHFAANGAEVLVNISDDGWYGDTSAPWQHLNMARMRAVENRRWLLRDTNNGTTAAIDPYGRVRQSIARHQVGELTAQFAFSTDVTFYSAHGDVFAWICVLLSLGMVGWAEWKQPRA